MTNDNEVAQQFQDDKSKLLRKAAEYCQNNDITSLDSTVLIQVEFGVYRDNARNLLKEGKYSEAIQNLEKAREAKTGIKIIEEAGDPLIIIRDARNAADPKVRETESYEMQYLNTIRAAMDIVDIHYPNDLEKSQNLKKELKEKAQNFIEDFSKSNINASQDKLSSELRREINEVANSLEKGGIDKPVEKLNVAKDFQNFNDQHANIVTISSLTDKDNKKHTVIEAEVGFRQLTDNQKKEYQNIIDPTQTKPKWFTSLPNWESKLVEKYTPQIIDGKHSISTQLRQIVGMKNAFEKVTAVYDEKSNGLKVINSSKHAGTLTAFPKDKHNALVTFIKNKLPKQLSPIFRDKKKQQEITNLNAEQMQEWVGKDTKLHTNTLNSGFVGISLPFHIDMEIVKTTNKAMEKIGGSNTNTALNGWRVFGGFSNLTGTKDYLKEVAQNLTESKDPTKFVRISSHLEPRGMFSRILGLNKPKGNFDDLIKDLEPKIQTVLKEAYELKKDVEKADVPYRLSGDKENISLDIARKLHSVTHKVSELSGTEPLKTMPKHEITTMCASGKDRTGFTEQDKTDQALAKELNMDIREVDKQMVKNGHTAGQTGGIYAGGATIGCHGTLKVTAEGFPESRKAELSGIIEKSGATNKITKYKEPKQSQVKTPKKQISSKKEDKQPLIPPPTPALTSQHNNKKISR